MYRSRITKTQLISYVPKSLCTETVHHFVPKLSCSESDITPYLLWQPMGKCVLFLAWCIIRPCIQYTAGAASMAAAWFIHWPVHGSYGPFQGMTFCYIAMQVNRTFTGVNKTMHWKIILRNILSAAWNAKKPCHINSSSREITITKTKNNRKQGNGNLRNAKVQKVICKITCEKCVREIGKTRKIHLCEISV